MQHLISAKEAAQRLGTSPETVKRLIHVGQLQAEKFQGSWVIDEASLQKLEQHRPDGRTFPAGQISREMAAKKLGVSVDVIRGMIRRGELQATKQGRFLIIDKDSLNDCLHREGLLLTG